MNPFSILYHLTYGNLTFAVISAAVWGAVWAGFLQYVPLGRFLAQKRTWVTVVIGVGVDLLIALLVIPWEWWLRFFIIIAISSIPIIIRSLLNELAESREWQRALQSFSRKN